MKPHSARLLVRQSREDLAGQGLRTEWGLALASIVALTTAVGLGDNGYVPFILGELFAVAWAGLAFWRLLVQLRVSFRILDILAISSIGGNAAGALLSAAYSTSGEVGGFDVILKFYGLGIAELASAQLLANVFSLSLMVVSRIQIFPRARRQLVECIGYIGSTLAGRRIVTQLAIFVALAELVAIVTGRVGYRTYATSETVDPINALLVTVAPAGVFSAGAMLGFAVRQGISRRQIIIALAPCFVQTMWFFSAGRSQFVLALLCGVLGYACVARIRFRNLAVVTLAIFLPLTVVVFGLAQSSRYFQLSEESGFERIDVAIKRSIAETSSLSGEERAQLRANNDFNLAQRPLVLNYMGMLIQRRKQHNVGILGFEDLINNLLVSIPRKFLSDKSSILVAEPLYAERFGLPVSDNADSIVFSSYASFGVLGVLVFPVLLFFYIELFLGLLLKFGSDRSVILAIGALGWFFMQGGEMSLASIFVMPRNILIVVVFLKLAEVVVVSERRRLLVSA